MSQTKTTFYKEYLKPVTLEGEDFKFQKVIIWKMEENTMSFIRMKEAGFLDGQKYSRFEFFDKMMDEEKLSMSRIDVEITDIKEIMEIKENAISSKRKEFLIEGDLGKFEEMRRQLKKFVVFVK